MHSFLGQRRVILACLAALGVAALGPSLAVAAAKPDPVKKAGFRLFARAGGSLRVNQVQCGIISDGQICVDSLGSSTIPGSVWPKGTNNAYTFNSGIQIVGIIGPEMPAWAGDTTGSPFFEGSGGLLAGEQIEPIYNASDPADFNNWPDFARVPSEAQGDAGATIYDPLLQGTISASQGDVYFITWDGNPADINGRPHPLGVAVETRGLAWNFPAGNQDIIYFIYTLYNISSVRDADYVNIRPALKARLLEVAADYQARNEAAFGVDIPEGGYTIENAFMAFAADHDVTAAAGQNLASFNNLFDLAVTYHSTFTPSPGNVFDPGIHAPPFLPGPGFVGTKYLRSPILPDGTESGTVLAGQTTNRGSFPDAADLNQLYRYLSGNVNPAAGDPQCNQGDPDVTGICFVAQQAQDVRTFQSSGPLTLLPGGQATIVVAYIFAAPVSTGTCPSIPCPTTLVPDAVAVSTATPGDDNVAPVDSAMGWRGFKPGTVDPVQDSVATVVNSLLSKALVAQQIFDSKFLLPFGPQAPEFFLVPGDNQVTILWRPSTSETSGDAFFAIANDPTRGAQYDPSYRQFDVEGYRIYRGRTDTPNQLELVAQFDYEGTAIYDFRGLINANETCAPELGVVAGCGSPFTIPAAGARFPDSLAFDISGDIVQVRPGQRVLLTTGTVRNNVGPTATDTAVVGLGSGFPPLANTGVPFAYTDDGSGLLSAPRNNVRYFYTVTAFDVNSFASGPSSLESQRIARAVVPTRQAPNVQTASLTSGVFGSDGTELLPDAAPPFTIDAQTGRFSGPPPPTAATALQGVFAPLVPILLPSLDLTATIDSVQPRSAECGALGNIQGICYEFFVTFDRSGTTQQFRTLAPWTIGLGPAFGDPAFDEAQLGSFPVAPDATAAARYSIPDGATSFNAAVEATLTRNIRFSAHENQFGRRFGNAPPGGTTLLGVSAGGSRWFEGANESVDDPTYSIRVGHLTGVDTIYAPLSHIDQDPGTPAVQAPASSTHMQCAPYAVAPLGRQADIEVTWGPAGTLASVQDITHKVPVPFQAVPQASYGFIGDANGNGVVDWADFELSEGVAPHVAQLGFCGTALGFPPEFTDPGPGARALLTEQPTIGPVSTVTDPPGATLTGFTATGTGFGLYINGQQFIFQLTGGQPPVEGTKWTLRTYSGRVDAATGPETTDPGGYTYRPDLPSPAVPGLEIRFNVAGATAVAAPRDEDLNRVHTVPDPYYVTSGFETTTTDKVIRFVNLPTQAIIRIYSSSGVLVRMLTHNSLQRGASDEDVSVLGGEETWDVRNRNNQVVASGVYFFHIESGGARRVGRFTVVNFAQ
ncbi:MAG TPA: hypothetical protein VFS51_06970 [Gemmatimonadales bacterium]|nr:hypothetical protein [Gemmatimonadales bacterium]